MFTKFTKTPEVTAGVSGFQRKTYMSPRMESQILPLAHALTHIFIPVRLQLGRQPETLGRGHRTQL